MFPSKEDNYRRDSFEDRFCDDLCEEILQYLSLEDKLKLEGVSKYFQRTVFKKHYELVIETKSCTSNREKNEDIECLCIEDIFIDLKSLEVLLKKCPNITSIELKPYAKCNYKEVFRLITKCCNNLREIDFLENEINDENIEEFQQKFGPKINFTYFKKPNKYDLSRKITKIIEPYLKSESNKPFSRLKLNNLKKLEMNFLNGEEDMIKTCIDTFPTLTHFSINRKSECKDENVISSRQSISVLKFISNLKIIKHFGFDNVFIKSHKNLKLFCDSLKPMINKCQKLKSIEFGFEIDSEISDIRPLITVFVAFRQLKRLSLNFIIHKDFDINELFSFEAFKGLSNITHLTLDFADYLSLNFFKDIDIFLPKLQCLYFEDVINATPEEVTQIADILSRLSRLQTLKLLINKKVDYKEIEVKIREKCRKIRSIDLKHYNND